MSSSVSTALLDKQSENAKAPSSSMPFQDAFTNFNFILSFQKKGNDWLGSCSTDIGVSMNMNTFQIISRIAVNKLKCIDAVLYVVHLECDFGISSPAYTFRPLAKHLAPGTRNWFQLMFSSVMLLFSAEFEKKDLSDKIYKFCVWARQN